MIKFNGWGDTPIYVDKNKIIGCAPNKSEEYSTIFVSVGNASEEWQVRETIESVLEKISKE